MPYFLSFFLDSRTHSQSYVSNKTGILHYKQFYLSHTIKICFPYITKYSGNQVFLIAV